MLESRRIHLLTDKFYMLGTEHLKLIRSGKYDKAEKVGRKMNEVSQKIYELSGKQYDKVERKTEDLIAQLDRKIEEFEFFQMAKERENQEKINEILRGK